MKKYLIIGLFIIVTFLLLGAGTMGLVEINNAVNPFANIKYIELTDFSQKCHYMSYNLFFGFCYFFYGYGLGLGILYLYKKVTKEI